MHFRCVNSHGFLRNKARDIRLKALTKLLDYAKNHNVGIIVFEKIRMNKKAKTKSKRANRKIARFASREMLSYGINMALRRGFRVYLVNPRNTSKEAKEIHNSSN